TRLLAFSRNHRSTRPTLFPYTTLFRSRRRIKGEGEIAVAVCRSGGQVAKISLAFAIARRITQSILIEINLVAGSAGRCAQRAARSEEHTSELQSLRHLVCRLLLEKKKY